MITATTKTARTLSGAGKYTGSWGKDQVMHLLRRTMFAVKKSDLDYFMSKTMEQAVDELLTAPSTLPDPPVNNYNNARITDPDIPLGETWVNGPANPALTGARRNSWKSWWVGTMVNQGRTIQDKLTLFWHNHFATETNVYRDPIHAYNHGETLRAGALGNFRSLVMAVTIDPAMLIYLNGNKNTAQAPDENYARELQELFTLGKGPDSKYTEEDVREAARVLTGWRINRATNVTYFDARQHDVNDKKFSAFFNNTTITGRSGTEAGEQELNDLLDMIFDQDEVARHMVRKLYRWFIYYDIDEAAEQNVIQPLAQVFINNNYEIKPLLDAFFKSEHFFDPINYGCLIKSPLDYSVGLARQFNLDIPTDRDVANQYYFWNILWQVAFIQQQDLGDPPSVAGWPAYYQVPQFHEIWINTDTLPKRNQITDILIAAGVSRGGHTMQIQPIAIADMFSKPEDPNALIDDLVDFLHTLNANEDQKEYMKSILLAGQLNDSYWTQAWNDHKADPDDVTKKNTVLLRLMQLLKYLMNLAEFQLS